MLFDLPRPVVFAHRGSSAHAPENTLAAFSLALQQGANAIELDSMLSADGHAVVIHDENLNRIAGIDKEVKQLTLTELKALDAGKYFNASFEGERIPTLIEVFETVGKKIFINIELKNLSTPTDDLPKKVAELVRRFGLEEYIIFSSFNPLALIRIHQLLPQMPIGLLADSGWLGYWARSGIGRLIKYDALHPWLGDVSNNMVASSHSRGKRVHVYTVNNPVDIRRMVDLDVDGFFSDDPVLALQTLNRGSAQT
jgi:glycerophosphoryl diester phosphodiesterase